MYSIGKDKDEKESKLKIFVFNNWTIFVMMLTINLLLYN